MNFQKGSAIFEILIVVAIVAVVITSVVASTTGSVRNSLHARYQAESTRRAQELAEWLRGERDTSWTTFAPRASGGIGATYCFGDTLSWAASSCSGAGAGAISGTPFTRSVNLRQTTTVTANDTVDVVVTVTWVDGTGSHNSRVSTRLTSWNN